MKQISVFRDIILLVIIIGFLIGTVFAGGVEGESGEGTKLEEIEYLSEYLPPVNTKFTFHVKSSGDKVAITSLWEKPGERDEIHQFMGIKEGVKGKTKSRVIEDSEPRTCAWWRTTVPSDQDYYADFNYALKNNGLYIYREEESTGGLRYYINCLKAVSFPITAGDGWADKTTFYTYIPDTGVSLSPTYESKGLTSDSIKVKVTVDKKENITTPAGTFECYKVTTIFTSYTGKWLTAATTTTTQKRWWSPELNYFVKERDSISINAVIDASGTITKELTNYQLASSDMGVI
ncbi:MAG TPA: hypothetical protein HA346_01065 [Thermoplasmata archaeon]|nr:hypothetical protein [Thermoplasmata archaeon]